MGAIDTTFGALMCGTVVASWMYGMICILTYQYYNKYPKDPLHLKLLVGLLCLVQLLEIYVLTSCVYWYLVTSWGNAPALTILNWEWATSFVIQGFTATCVQLYYSYRVYKLSKCKLAVAFVVTVSLVQLGFSSASAYVAWNVRRFAPLGAGTYSYMAYVIFTGNVACDLLLSGVQIWFLLRHNTGIRGTNRIVKLLVVYLISTGALTSVSALLHLTTFVTLGYNFTQNFVSAFAAGLYVLSLHANLDVRGRARALRAGLSVDKDDNRLEPLRFTIGPMHSSTPGTDCPLDTDSDSAIPVKTYELPISSYSQRPSEGLYDSPPQVVSASEPA